MLGSAGLNPLVSQALPGTRPGTERWIVCFERRGFDLRAKLAEIRAQTTASARAQKQAELEALTRQDQRVFGDFLRTRGGLVRQNYWVQNACSVEVTPAELDRLRRFTNVRRLWPDEARSPGVEWTAVSRGAVAPITESLNQWNHNVGPAYALQTTEKSRRRASGSLTELFDGNEALPVATLIYETISRRLAGDGVAGSTGFSRRRGTTR